MPSSAVAVAAVAKVEGVGGSFVIAVGGDLGFVGCWEPLAVGASNVRRDKRIASFWHTLAPLLYADIMEKTTCKPDDVFAAHPWEASAPCRPSPPPPSRMANSTPWAGATWNS